MTRRRGPREAGAPDAREEILEVARRLFSTEGYHGATLRRIASGAGVDPSLLLHYFGSKEGLFAESVELHLRPEEIGEQVFGGSGGTPGIRLATLFFDIWERPDTRERLLAQLRVGLGTGEPPPMRDFISTAVLSRIGEFVEGEDAELRIELAAAHLVGVAVLRYVLQIEPLAGASVDRIVAQVAPRIDSYLAESA